MDIKDLTFKARLAILNKSMSVDLRKALKERGIHASIPEISIALNKNSETTKSREIVKATKEIISEWEESEIER